MTEPKDADGMGLTRRQFSAMSLGIAAASLAGARPALSATDEATLVAAAKKEGRVTVYSNADPAAIERAIKGFIAKYGFAPDVQRLTGAALAQRFTAEYESGVFLADFFISSDPVFPKAAIKKGWLQRVDDLPSLAAWPKDDLKEGLVSLGLNPYTLCYNKMLVPEGVTGWEALNDKKFRGKVLVGDPRVLASARNWYAAMRGKFGDDYIRELGSLAAFSPSAVPGLQQLGAGAVAIYAPATYLNALDIIERGAPVVNLLIDPIVMSVPFGALVTKAPHPNAAKLLLNFIMSREGQELYNENGFSLLPNIPKTRTLASKADLDPEEGDRQLPDILKLLKLG